MNKLTSSLSAYQPHDKIIVVDNSNNELTNPNFYLSSELRYQNAERNQKAIADGWSLMESEIVSETDLDRKHIVNIEIRLGETTKMMKLVFQRDMASKRDAYYNCRLDLYEPSSDLRGRAPCGLMIIWSLKRDFHRISTTELKSLPGYASNGLGVALLKLADTIITTKLVPLTSLDPRYSELPIVGLIEDTARDSKGIVSHWTTFQAEQLGYTVTGKNDNGWPVLTKKLA